MSTETEVREVAVGLFDNRHDAEQAVAELQKAGFATRDIGIAARDSRGEWHEFRSGGERGVGRGAIAGAATGAGVGSLWAMGVAAGILPAIGPVIAGGLLLSLLASAATAAAAGGLVGALIGMGFSEEEARFYEDEFAQGRILVTVRARERFLEASNILERHGMVESMMSAGGMSSG